MTCLVECLLYSKHPVTVGCLISPHSSLWNCPTLSSPAFWPRLSHSSPNPFSIAQCCIPCLPSIAPHCPQHQAHNLHHGSQSLIPSGPCPFVLSYLSYSTCEPWPHFHCFLSPAYFPPSLTNSSTLLRSQWGYSSKKPLLILHSHSGRV